jgi:hypothetical protein
MTLEIEVGVEGRNHVRIDHKPLGWLVHAVTNVSIGREKFPTMHSRVTRLHKKLEVMSVDLPSVRNEIERRSPALPLPNSDESQFGRWTVEFRSLSG